MTGEHGVEEIKELTAWLASDEACLGEPARRPSCGDVS